jgi:hypothetical protein
MNSTSLFSLECSSIFLPFLLPLPTIFLFLFFHFITNLFPFNIKINGKNYSSNLIQISQYRISQLFMIGITSYFWYNRVDYSNYMKSVDSNLAIKGWYIDYLGVLLLTIINSYNLENLTLKLFITKFFQLWLIPGLHLLDSMVLLVTNKQKSIINIIIYSIIGLFQLYKWESIVYKYDMLFNKCFLGGFIDLSNPTSIYITVLMIIVYYYQLVLFTNKRRNEMFFYLLSVIAFMNGTVALSIYLIYFELNL